LSKDPTLGSIRRRVLRVRALAWGVVALLACSTPPRPNLVLEIPLDARVRVTARQLGPGWYPGRLIRSGDRCKMVTVATANHPEPIAVLNMGQIDLLQLSRKNPPPDWWTDPSESEGWSAVDMEQLRNEPDRCRSRYPTTPPP
jgi:hypothetical protein